MAIFRNEEEVRAFFELFLEKIGKSAEASQALHNSGLILHFHLLEPEASVKIDTLSAESPSGLASSLFFGEEGPQPDLTLEMTADTLDELWSGKRDIFGALISGKVKISGHMAKASRLVPLLKLIPPIYEETRFEFEKRKTDEL
jgi:hypothetical protein